MHGYAEYVHHQIAEKYSRNKAFRTRMNARNAMYLYLLLFELFLRNKHSRVFAIAAKSENIWILYCGK